MTEATSAETPHGRQITSEGWFVLNLGDAFAVRNAEKGGAHYRLEPEAHPFPNVGVQVTVLPPGQPNGLYHSEAAQEGFLVLSGTCTLVVEEQERELRQWDYVHCPPGTAHIFVGAGSEPCAILMIGSRPDEPIHYAPSPVAARHGASVSVATDDPDRAYADWPGEYEPTRLPWPPTAGGG
ncbi:MAG TPA: cupin domain-containing protein [Solirubrobacteraceae bacterium]|nr:cupin domain-containing protein [Solirubrobacteraceae bacterium]